jgi:hypothetical protein
MPPTTIGAPVAASVVGDDGLVPLVVAVVVGELADLLLPHAEAARVTAPATSRNLEAAETDLVLIYTFSSPGLRLVAADGAIYSKKSPSYASGPLQWMESPHLTIRSAVNVR